MAACDSYDSSWGSTRSMEARETEQRLLDQYSNLTVPRSQVSAQSLLAAAVAGLPMLVPLSLCSCLVVAVRLPSKLTETLPLQAIQEIYQLLSQQGCWWCQHYDCEGTLFTTWPERFALQLHHASDSLIQCLEGGVSSLMHPNSITSVI